MFIWEPYFIKSTSESGRHSWLPLCSRPSGQVAQRPLTRSVSYCPEQSRLCCRVNFLCELSQENLQNHISLSLSSTSFCSWLSGRGISPEHHCDLTVPLTEDNEMVWEDKGGSTHFLYSFLWEGEQQWSVLCHGNTGPHSGISGMCPVSFVDVLILNQTVCNRIDRH